MPGIGVRSAERSGPGRSLAELEKAMARYNLICDPTAYGSVEGTAGTDLIYKVDQPGFEYDFLAIYSRGGDDVVVGADRLNRINTGDGDDWVWGGESTDLIELGAGDDTALGGGGNDVLIGGTGYDLLSGGEGADTFVFSPSSGPEPATRTTILDFEDGDAISIADPAIGMDDLLRAASVEGDSVVFSFAGSQGGAPSELRVENASLEDVLHSVELYDDVFA